MDSKQKLPKVEKLDGGMAFPYEWQRVSDDWGFSIGLSKLEYVAAQVLKGMYSNSSYDDRTPAQLTEMAFEQASHFLKKYRETLDLD